jgi:hypothetical protein
MCLLRLKFLILSENNLISETISVHETTMAMLKKMGF